MAQPSTEKPPASSESVSVARVLRVLAVAVALLVAGVTVARLVMRLREPIAVGAWDVAEAAI